MRSTIGSFGPFSQPSVWDQPPLRHSSATHSAQMQQCPHRSGGTNMAHLGNLYHSQTAFRQAFLPGPDPPSRSSMPTARTRQDDTFG
jgi:hypothetical protein